MKSLLLVGLGGFVGAVLRYLVTVAVERLAPVSLFPWATLAVNVVGCLALGLLAGLVEARQAAAPFLAPALSPQVRLLVGVGLLGAFTTYSTFGWETVVLARGERLGAAFGSVAAHLILGLGAAWLGGWLGLTVLGGGRP